MKNTQIDLQRDIVAQCFRDVCFNERLYMRLLFSKTSHRKKKEQRKCLNNAIREHSKHLQILDEMEKNE